MPGRSAGAPANIRSVSPIRAYLRAKAASSVSSRSADHRRDRRVLGPAANDDLLLGQGSPGRRANPSSRREGRPWERKRCRRSTGWRARPPTRKGARLFVPWPPTSRSGTSSASTSRKGQAGSESRPDLQFRRGGREALRPVAPAAFVEDGPWTFAIQYHADQDLGALRAFRPERSGSTDRRSGCSGSRTATSGRQDVALRTWRARRQRQRHAPARSDERLDGQPPGGLALDSCLGV